MVAAHSLLHRDQSAWRCKPAPGAEEVVWQNVVWRAWERSCRRVLATAAFVALTLFYIIPITAVQVRACAVFVCCGCGGAVDSSSCSREAREEARGVDSS